MIGYNVFMFFRILGGGKYYFSNQSSTMTYINNILGGEGEAKECRYRNRL